MKNNPKIIGRRFLISFLITMAFFCGSTYAEPVDPAGQAIFVHDSVWRIPADQAKIPLIKGDSVYETDTITTGAKGSVQLVMSDGAYISIRPNTSIRLDIYHYDTDEERGVGKSVISLLKGCFRSITGMIGKENKENYKVKTPVASIGIRGTDHEPLYIPEPEDGEEIFGEPGLYDKVNSGQTYIENEAGVVTVLPNQVGYVSDETSIAVVYDMIPDVYEGFQTTGDDEVSESSEDEYTEVTSEDMDITALVSDVSSLEKQTGAQDFAVDLSTVQARPDEYYGIFNWPDAVGYTGVLGSIADATEIIRDDAGALYGYQLEDLTDPNPDWIRTVRLVNPTVATKGQSDHYTETTIEFGTWQADSIETVTYGGTVETHSVDGGLVHWITGTIYDYNYLSQVITGTQTYTFDGGTSPINQDGIAGTLTSATLSVDFSRQALDVGLQMNVNSHDWSANADNVPIDRGTFTASNQLLTVERDGDSTYTSGYLNGSFAGEGLTGVLLGYTLVDTALSEIVSGTASFYAPAQDSTAIYREIGIAGTDSRASMSSTLAMLSPSSATSLSFDNSGYLTGFDTMIPEYESTISGNEQTAVHFDISSATLNDTGSDTDTGISWGRWSGAFSSTDRATGTTTSPSLDSQELHFISGPEMSSSVSLPIMGTKTYTFAGGTNPTDNLGHVGTLNSASLSADFTNMTVATGINATVGTTTFDALSEATPIESGRYFTATTDDSLTLACTGDGVGTVNTGIISGAFYGESGESAGVTYSFNTTDGASIDTTVSGVAAFK